jgi:hypothetical protein
MKTAAFYGLVNKNEIRFNKKKERLEGHPLVRVLSLERIQKFSKSDKTLKILAENEIRFAYGCHKNLENAFQLSVMSFLMRRFRSGKCDSNFRTKFCNNCKCNHEIERFTKCFTGVSYQTFAKRLLTIDPKEYPKEMLKKLLKITGK